MQTAYPDTAIIIFAKEPVPGKVKTRLIPALGGNNAARLYEQMFEHVINTIVASQLAEAYLYVTPESNRQYFQKRASCKDLQIRIQQGKDLGQKMFNALNETLNHYKRAVLIGTDCPFLDAAHLHQAIAALAINQANNNTMVFTPALDGGYVLVGASKICREVFDTIDWGTARVMSQTRTAMKNKQIQWQELDSLQDIDRPEYLSSLSQLAKFRQ